MKLTYFSRMKAYRKDGRLSVILKLSLPLLDSECDADAARVREFNSFYTALAEKYISALSFSSLGDGLEKGRVSSVTVGYEVIEVGGDLYKKAIRKCKNPIAIRRFARINSGGTVKQSSYTDIYDAALGVFVK